MADDDCLKALRMAMTVILVTTYGISWTVAALSHVGNASPMSILATVSMVVTLPYFAMRSCLMFVVGTMISLAIVGFSILIPPLAVIFLAFGIGMIGVKLWTLVRTVPLVILGMFFYQALRIPAVIGDAVSDDHRFLRWFIALALGVFAIVIAALVLVVCAKFFAPHFAAAVMFGFTGYIIISLVLLIIPGITDTDGGDGDNDGS